MKDPQPQIYEINMSKAKTVAFMGIFCTLALILSYLESLIPISFGIPGVKLGLANLVIVFMLYFMKPGYAVIVNLVRVVLAGLLFGNVFGIIYSAAGAIVSFLVMWPLSRIKKFSVIGVSVAGGIAHNMGQLIVAVFVVGAVQVMYYVPVLLISGVVTGIVMGIIAKIMINNIKKIGFFRV